jgi:tetratricopeptide (TPR) repeat protein
MAKAPLIPPSAPDPEKINPQDNEELVKRGWLFYGRQNYDRALDDFSKAEGQDPENPDIIYAIGLTYKASGAGKKAIENFEKVLLHMDKYSDPVEARMLLRLIHGHINQLTKGDWNLEKEIWHYVR